MSRKASIQKVSAAIAVLLLALLAAGEAAIHSSPFRNYVRSEIRRQALQKAGARVEIAAVEIPWSRLAVILNDVIVRDARDRGQTVPVLRARRFEVGLRFWPLLHGDLQLSDAILDRPLIHIQIDSRGNSNLPAPAKTPADGSASAPDRIFSLKIGECSVREGEVSYNDARTPLNADLHNLIFESTYHTLAAQYGGSLAYDGARIAYGPGEPLAHSLRLNFSANRAGLSISRATIALGGSHLNFSAHLANYENPAIDGDYQAVLITTELARALHLSLPGGQVAAEGTVGYHPSGSQPLLTALSVEGRMRSDKLSFPAGRTTIDAGAVSAAYKFSSANLSVENVAATVLGGRLAASAQMQHVDRPKPPSRFDAMLQGVPLAAASGAFASHDARRIPFTGTANLEAHGTLQGSLDSLILHTRLAVVNSRSPQARVPQESRAISLSGLVVADYDGPRNTLALNNSYLQTSSTRVIAAGTLHGGRAPGSQIDVTASTSDLREVASLIQLVQQSLSSGAPPPRAVDISGTATLAATIRGTARDPQIQGHLAALNLAAGRSRWRELALDFDASPERFAVRNGMLAALPRGQAQFSGSAALRRWVPSPDSQVALQANLSNLSLSGVSEVAQLHYPVDGTLSGQIALQGTERDPQGHAMLTVAHGSAWSEPFDDLAVQGQFGQGAVESTINLKMPAGAMAANAGYNLSSRQYVLKVQASGVQLEKIAFLERLTAIHGSANLSATGTGTIDDPQLDARLSIPGLSVQDQPVSGMSAQVSMAHQHATLAVHGGIDQGTMDAKGDVALTGAKYSTAEIDVRALPVAALLARFLPAQAPRAVSGQIEAHATIHGPLAAPEQMEAHLELSPLAVKYADAEFSLPQALRADYRVGLVTVAPAHIEGPGTDLRFGGTIPIGGKGLYALSADGNVDLAVLQRFDPEVHSAGRMEVHLKSGKDPARLTLEGTFSVKDAVLSSAALPVGIEGLNAQINLSGNRADIANFSGTAGGGNVSARGFFTYGSGGNFNVSLDANSVRVRYPTGLRSVLSAQIALQGSPADSALTGRVLVDRLSFTQEFDLSNMGGFFSSDSSGTAGSAFARNMKLNVAVQSSRDLSVANSKISMAGSAGLRMTGTLAGPVLLGRIALTGGDVFFLSKRFTVQSGTIQFTNPARTDPVVNLYVNTTVQQYDVTMKLSGPVDRLRTDFTSNPSLPPADIIHLLAFGNTTEEANAQPSQSAQMGAESVLASGVSSQVAGKLENVTGLSQVTLDPLATNSQGNPGAQIAIQERVTGSILLTFSTDVTSTQYSAAEIQYQLNKKLSVSALRDQNGGYGVDLRYHKAF